MYSPLGLDDRMLVKLAWWQGWWNWMFLQEGVTSKETWPVTMRTLMFNRAA